ncbi:hypothetical protein CUROG_06710 [Corynebacterium urogenitale]|uniref:Secreted protein n=1 Tax=Corynebacterium urogenitale TaxID=2487892 RepID=A0A5J6Z6Q2_9CORY|nr:DUF2550 domain-containing protein [Corynebacterium urogenitale]QFQ02698.1 hypothetical protein CUROG_06710 [Corynebacterium urogenitale]
MKIILFLILGMLVLACLGALWRFTALRSKGYPVVIRSLPNEDARHWRHGVLVYSGTSAKFYKLRSIRPESDLSFTRLGTEIISRREITQRERNCLESDLHVIEVEHRQKRWELALDSQGDTALVAWLESGPSARRDRYSAYNHPRPI